MGTWTLRATEAPILQAGAPLTKALNSPKALKPSKGLSSKPESRGNPSKPLLDPLFDLHGNRFKQITTLQRPKTLNPINPKPYRARNPIKTQVTPENCSGNAEFEVDWEVSLEARTEVSIRDHFQFHLFPMGPELVGV